MNRRKAAVQARQAGLKDRQAYYAERARAFPPRPWDDASRADYLAKANAFVARTRTLLPALGDAAFQRRVEAHDVAQDGRVTAQLGPALDHRALHLQRRRALHERGERLGQRDRVLAGVGQRRRPLAPIPVPLRRLLS